MRNLTPGVGGVDAPAGGAEERDALVERSGKDLRWRDAECRPPTTRGGVRRWCSRSCAKRWERPSPWARPWTGRCRPQRWRRGLSRRSCGSPSRIRNHGRRSYASICYDTNPCQHARARRWAWTSGGQVAPTNPAQTSCESVATSSCPLPRGCHVERAGGRAVCLRMCGALPRRGPPEGRVESTGSRPTRMRVRSTWHDACPAITVTASRIREGSACARATQTGFVPRCPTPSAGCMAPVRGPRRRTSGSGPCARPRWYLVLLE